MPLRHSASQIFGSAHPALPRRESDDGALKWRGRRTAGSGQAAGASIATHVLDQEQNITSTAPIVRTETRGDRYNAQPPHVTPIPSLEEVLSEVAHFTPDLFSSGRMPIHSATPPFAPPSSQALQAAWRTHATQRDAASLHPVFFSARLQRSPFLADSDAAAMAITSPVAYGYAYPEKSRSGARL